MIVIHATAGQTLDSAVEWMMKPDTSVSAHYVVGKDGSVVQLVPEENKAWHAGKSSWKGQMDLNENSIGIELVNKNDEKDEYPDAQILSLAKLVSGILKANPKITLERIVGHNQIAPGRKSDPGLNFPWVKFGSYLQKVSVTVST